MAWETGERVCMHFLTVRSMFPNMRPPMDFKETRKFIINIRGGKGHQNQDSRKY